MSGVPRQTNCAECSNPLTGKQFRYCSDACRNRVRIRNWAATQREARQSDKGCEYCGETFRGNSHQRYCDSVCSSEARIERKSTGFGPTPCEACGTVFTPKTLKNKWCSRECWRVARRPTLSRAQWEANKKSRERQVCCAFCEKPFLTSNSKRAYCKPRCKVLAKIRRQTMKYQERKQQVAA